VRYVRLHRSFEVLAVPSSSLAAIGDTSIVWDNIVQFLNGSATALSWDLRGHGRSERCEDPKAYASQFAVTDLTTMIATAGGSADNPAVLIGHSLGGYLSLRAAVEYPQLVKALVLISTGPGFGDSAAREQWNQYARSMDIGVNADPAARQLGIQSDGAVIKGLGSIRVPALVIVGSDDRRFVPAKDCLVSRIPNASEVVVAEGRHSVHKTHSGEVGRAILSFLEVHSLL